jgi:hypothetical protein
MFTISVVTADVGLLAQAKELTLARARLTWRNPASLLDKIMLPIGVFLMMLLMPVLLGGPTWAERGAPLTLRDPSLGQRGGTTFVYTADDDTAEAAAQVTK